MESPFQINQLHETLSTCQRRPESSGGIQVEAPPVSGQQPSAEEHYAPQEDQDQQNITTNGDESQRSHEGGEAVITSGSNEAHGIITLNNSHPIEKEANNQTLDGRRHVPNDPPKTPTGRDELPECTRIDGWCKSGIVS